MEVVVGVTEDFPWDVGEIRRCYQLSLAVVFHGCDCCVCSFRNLAVVNMLFGPDRYWAHA